MINDFRCQLSRMGMEVKYQRFMILTTKEVVVGRGTKDANILEGLLFSPLQGSECHRFSSNSLILP
jgi:hypothetical protein